MRQLVEAPLPVCGEYPIEAAQGPLIIWANVHKQSARLRARPPEPTMSQTRSPQDKPVVSRRTAVAGAGVAGAAAAALAVLPRTPADPAATTAAASPADNGAAGYRESEHVLRYYRTARV